MSTRRCLGIDDVLASILGSDDEDCSSMSDDDFHEQLNDFEEEESTETDEEFGMDDDTLELGTSTDYESDRNSMASDSDSDTSQNVSQIPQPVANKPTTDKSLLTFKNFREELVNNYNSCKLPGRFSHLPRSRVSEHFPEKGKKTRCNYCYHNRKQHNMVLQSLPKATMSHRIK